VAVRDSVVERNAGASLVAMGSDATIERTRVLDTRPAVDGGWGRGVIVQDRVETGNVGTMILRDVRVERSVEVGVLVVNSTAEIERVAIADTAAGAAGALGDGIDVVTDGTATAPSAFAMAHVVASQVRGSARAGVAAFGAGATIEGTTLDCNAIQLDGETYATMAFEFNDGGGNTCGCAGAADSCSVLSSSLAPPDPIALE
jgi:hypothetical protein